MSTTDQQAADSTTTIDLDLWFDLVSPWSWVTRRRLEAAVHAFERPSDVTVTLRSFVLDTTRRPGSGDTELGRAASEAGLAIDLDAASPATSLDAHRLVALALAQGGPALQSAAAERFWAAHFSEGLAIDDPLVLQRAGAECGLDERRVAAVLAGEEFVEQVRADERAAVATGITSVPVVVANGYAALTGARPSSDYLALLRGVATDAR